MRRAITTLSVLAIVSFAFSTAVAFTIASTATPTVPTSDSVIPAVDGPTASQCPAMGGVTTPRCPALQGAGPSVQTVIEAARKAGCPAFARDVQEAVVTTERDVSVAELSRS